MTHLSIGVNFTATCGNCGEEIDHDGDSFVCERCRIYFDEDTLRAYPLDEDEPACGAPYPWPTPIRDIRPGGRSHIIHRLPCALPASHNPGVGDVDHHHPTIAIFGDAATD